MRAKEKTQDLKALGEEFEKMGYTLYTEGFHDVNDFLIGLENETGKLAEVKMGLNSKWIMVRKKDQKSWDETVMLLQKIESLFTKWGMGYFFLEGDSRLMTLGYLNFNKFYAKELQGEKKLTNLMRKLEHEMDNCKREIPSLSYDFEYESWKEVYVNFCTFYQKERMLCTMNQDCMDMLINGERQIMKQEELYLFLKTMIEKNDKVQKLQAVFSSPKHPYLTGFLKEKVNHEFFRGKEGKEKIVSILSKWYTYEEIEKIAKEKIEKREAIPQYTEKRKFIALIPFGKLLLFVNKENITIKEDHEKAVEEFQEKIVKFALGGSRMDSLNRIKNLATS